MIQGFPQLQWVNQGITASVSFILFINAFTYELECGYPAAVVAYPDSGKVCTVAHMKGASEDTTCFKCIHFQ